MLFDGISMVQGSDVEHFALNSFAILPEEGKLGQLILVTGVKPGVYVYQESGWVRLLDTENKVNAVITLTGEVTGSGSNEIHTFLTDTGVANGTYGNNTNVPRLIINDDGRVTDAKNIPIELDASAIQTGVIQSRMISSEAVIQHQMDIRLLESQIIDGDLLARKSDNEHVFGAWKFFTSPVVPYPINDECAVNKSYVDSQIRALQAQIDLLKIKLPS